MKAVEHRAAARIAWRQARGAKARTALVLFLIALPIAALTLAGVLIRTAIANPEDKVNAELGTADAGSNPFLDATGYKRLVAALPIGTRLVSTKLTSAYKVAGGTLVSLSVIENSMPADRDPVAIKYVLLRGRMPHTAGEATLTPAVARQLQAGIGGTIRFGGLERAVTIVGIAVERYSLRDPLLLVGPGTLNVTVTESGTVWLFDFPQGVNVRAALENLRAKGIGFEDRPTALSGHRIDQTRLSGFSFAGAAVALFFTALIVAAAFGVGARRQLRAHGLVEAAGGEPKHVHAIVLWGGTLQGLLGSLIGVALGVAAAFVFGSHIDSLVNRVVRTVRVPWWSLAGALVLGTTAATIAALAPARQASQISALEALAGRLPRPQQPGRLARRGLVGVVIGGVFTVVATVTREYTLLVIALCVMMIGFLLAIPILVAWLGRSSSYLPAISRLAARQTARYGRRTGAAIAAATLALTAPVAVGAILLSRDRRNNQTALIGADQMILSSRLPSSEGFVPQDVLDAARRAVPGSVVARIRYATGTPPASGPFPQAPQIVSVYGPPIRTANGDAANAEGTLTIASADLLRATNAEAGIPYIHGRKIIAVGYATDRGVVHVQLPTGGPRGAEPIGSICGGLTPGCYPAPPDVKSVDVPAVSVPGGSGSAVILPRFFVPPEMVKGLGLDPGYADQAVLRAPHPLRGQEIQRVKRAISLIPAAYAQSQHDYMSDSTNTRLIITASALTVALIILAVAISLVGAESRRELAILTAVGASPGSRKRMAGANALFMTAVAGLLAVPAGLVPVILVLLSQRPREPVVIPWSLIGVVALAAPLLAGAFAALVSRQPKARAMLQPNW